MAVPYSQYYIQDGQEIFDYEDVCELTALSNNFINRVVNEYNTHYAYMDATS